jgi:hypothetical protein
MAEVFTRQNAISPESLPQLYGRRRCAVDSQLAPAIRAESNHNRKLSRDDHELSDPTGHLLIACSSQVRILRALYDSGYRWPLGDRHD